MEMRGVWKPLISGLCSLWAFVLIASYCLLSPASASAGNVFFIINISAGTTFQGNPDYFEEFHEAKLFKRFPDTHFVRVRANSEADLYKQLSFLMGPSTQVDGFFLISHGRSDWNPISGYEAIVTSDNQDGSILRNMVSADSVHMMFGPLIGRFSDRALLLFGGCDLLMAGYDQVREDAMKKVAANFGLRSGEIYMNRKQGTYFTDVIIKQPLQKQVSGSEIARHAFFQLLAPITYPVFLVSDNLIYNKGYRLEVSRTGGTFSEDRFEAAEVGEKAGKPIDSWFADTMLRASIME